MFPRVLLLTLCVSIGHMVPPIADLALEVATFITSGITQPLEGVCLKVLYLAERVCCQLLGEDVPWFLMDPP